MTSDTFINILIIVLIEYIRGVVEMELMACAILFF